MELDDFRIGEEPYYRAVGDEVRLFTAAYAERMPIMLKGPTGCGKTRFVEYMAWSLERPLVTVACHEDMTASDLVGRYLLDAQGTVWHDGPLTIAVRHGAICYLDEIVEARQDTTVVIHPLTDDRRVLPLEKRGELVRAHPDFQLVISYNPGYQSVLKDLKELTKQRFGAMDFGYPPATIEAEIVAHEARHRTRVGGEAGRDRPTLAQSQGPRPRRGRFDADADSGRAPHRARRLDRGRLPGRAGIAHHRRCRYQGRPDGGDHCLI